MKACFFTAGPLTWASSRMRAYWPARHMDSVTVPLAEVDSGRVPLPAADTYIFQKLYSERVREALPPDALVVWDVCDPAWWFDPEGAKAVLAAVDGVTACTEALADDLRGWDGWEDNKPVIVIPDCVNPAHFPAQAVHSDHEPIRFIWYGIYANRPALYAAQATLDRLAAEGYRIELTIMDERPDIAQVFLTSTAYPVYFTRWSLEQENEVIAAHDIALLPPYPGAWGLLKSDNKRLTAGACNVPATSGLHYHHTRRLVESASERQKAAEKLARKAELYRPDYVAYDWEQAFDDLSSHQRERAVPGENTAVLTAA